jgi:hypothetical protein
VPIQRPIPLPPADLTAAVPPACRQEYAELFNAINATMVGTTGFRFWHLLLWVPMVLFWAVGGFMLVIWGIQRAQFAGLAAIGKHADTFFARKPVRRVTPCGRASCSAPVRLLTRVPGIFIVIIYQGLSYAVIEGKVGGGGPNRGPRTPATATVLRVFLPGTAWQAVPIVQAEVTRTSAAATSVLSASGTADTIQLLRQLAELKDTGVLTDEEFQREKAKLLEAGGGSKHHP